MMKKTADEVSSFWGRCGGDLMADAFPPTLMGLASSGSIHLAGNEANSCEGFKKEYINEEDSTTFILYSHIKKNELEKSGNKRIPVHAGDIFQVFPKRSGGCRDKIQQFATGFQ